jgi:carboxypeptidase Taq
MSEALPRLREIMREVSDIRHAIAVMTWDQETYMPPGGVSSRANSLSTLGRRSHELFTSPEVGRLLTELEDRALDPESDEGALVAVTRRDYDLEVKIPSELVAEVARASSEAQPVWVRARRESDWAAFAPYLDRNIDLSRRVAEALGYEDRPYDALLSRNEPGVTTAQLEQLFRDLREAIVPLVRAIADRGDAVDDRLLYGDWDEQTQLEVGRRVVEGFGYDFERGRQDLSAHPFSIHFGHGDVRITTRVARDFLSQALYGSMHESGHGMYSQGHAAEYEGTPLFDGASPGMHESQSRLWENLVGRSRAYVGHLLPELQRAFPGQLDGTSPEEFYRAVNRVHPSLIRVEADEVTYNLHILMRFELENDMLEGEVRAADVPEAWDAKVRDYLGIEVPNVADGALQDIHWSFAEFAGFPSYTLGNVIGAQLMVSIRQELPDLDAQVAAGEFGPLHGWLLEKIYRPGRKYTPNELLERTTGRALTAQPWIDYVRQKFGDIYALEPSAIR